MASRTRRPMRVSLLALLLTFILPFAFVIYQLVNEINQRIEFTQSARYGCQYLQPLEQLLRDVPESQRIANRYFSKAANLATLQQQQQQVEQDMQAVVQVQQQWGDRLKTAQEFQALQQNWQHLNLELSRQSSQPNFSTTQTAIVEDLHTKLIAKVQDLISQVGNTSNLILDSDLDSYYLMDAILLKLPEVQELLGSLRLLGEDMIRQELTPEEREQLIAQMGVVQSDSDAIRKGMNVAFDHHPSRTLEAILQAPLHDSVSATQIFLNLLDQALSQAATAPVPLPAAEFDRTAVAALQASSNLWQAIVKQLDGLLQSRIERFRQKTYQVEAFALLVFTAVSYVFIAFSYNLLLQRRAARRLSAQH
ncbi:MAG TPA: hypothetical protein V6C57_18960, partial [Coleofasciculaceae cyanobacterium]